MPLVPSGRATITYVSPASHSLEPTPQHSFTLWLGEMEIGGADLDYYSRPLPIYQLTNLWVDPDYHSQGYDRWLLQKVMDFLEARRKPGVLVDAISPNNMAYGMYARHGWTYVPDSVGLYVFNWPHQLSLGILRGYEHRQTDYRQRPGCTIF